MSKKISHKRSVGYKCPPSEYQYKKGQSGNPHGRPKRKTNGDILQAFQEELHKKITVIINGKKVRITVANLLVSQAVKGALNGDKPMLKLLFNYMEKVGVEKPLPIRYSFGDVMSDL